MNSQWEGQDPGETNMPGSAVRPQQPLLQAGSPGVAREGGDQMGLEESGGFPQSKEGGSGHQPQEADATDQSIAKV